MSIFGAGIQFSDFAAENLAAHERAGVLHQDQEEAYAAALAQLRELGGEDE